MASLDSMSVQGTLTLKRGRVKPFLYRHPWVFDKAVHRVDSSVPPGGLVRVAGPDGAFIGIGFYNPRGPLVAKLFYWRDDRTRFDAAFFVKRLRQAAERPERRALAETTEAVRLAFAESDGLPGLIVDRYGDWVVAELTSFAMVQRRDMLTEALSKAFVGCNVLLRSDAAMSREEGFEPFAPEAICAALPDGPIVVDDGGLKLEADIVHGHKTGLYLDQRANRRRFAKRVSGARVLDVFCYAGGFGLAAARGGASWVVGVDNSLPALEAAERNAVRNGFEGIEWIKGKAAAVLRGLAAEGRRFDAVALDPPRLAPGRRALEGALKAYTGYNRQAIELLEPGGLLVTCSCSAAVGLDELIGAVNRGAVEAGRQARVVAVGTQDADHPAATALPESLYLKALFVRVD